jgi:hypothetical protein
MSWTLSFAAVFQESEERAQRPAIEMAAPKKCSMRSHALLEPSMMAGGRPSNCHDNEIVAKHCFALSREGVRQAPKLASPIGPVCVGSMLELGCWQKFRIQNRAH